MKTTSLALALLFFALALNAQSPPFEQTPVLVKRVHTPPVIDGKLTEEHWFASSPAKDFWLNFPHDTARSDVKTEIYFLFDNNTLYVGAICHSVGNNYVIPSLKRDYRAGGNDNITFLFDPFRDRTNAFVFGMNPYGVMREALVANGGREFDDFNESWDNRWTGESFIGDGFWSCELAIPFSALRFHAGEQEWFFNSYRFDTQTNTRSSWNRIPQNQVIMNLAYMNNMVWEEIPPKTGANIAVIPFVSGGLNKNFEEKGPLETTSGIGGDAKIAVTPSLNLDLTANPDFSQVEVDQQVLNLDRFEIFFPERRQFFLENADLFGAFGNPRINPFFSRRIGIGTDPEGNNIQLPIGYGARLSGKLDNNWRLGLLNMQTRQDTENLVPNQNFTVAALQRKLFSRSNLGVIFVNKEAFTRRGDIPVESRFNRVLGVDYNLASSDNRWNGKFFFHQNFASDKKFDSSEKFAHGARLELRERRFSISYDHQWVKEGYEPAVGYAPRTDYFQIKPGFSWFVYPKNKKVINQFSLGASSTVLWKPGFGNTDRETRFSFEADLANSGRLFAYLAQNYIYLFDAFDPTGTDARPLEANTGYQFWNVEGLFMSDNRKKFSYFLNPYAGQYFNGWRYSLWAGLTYRYQPYGSIEMNINFGYIDLPSPYAQAALLLVGPRIDVTFSKRVFLTTFIQYNNQIDNVNINARLQWRFAPVSDFFLVFTDNYNANTFGVKNRAVVAKLTYWLNM
ncbi:MAG: carbohydrate binding family 9 domain-containing protein [Haliscomenobacter sp.]|nr:carbohydrate binding family 9 domain-containing protein [Haliscomenobacter sp.]